jgi:hypothetical protein
VGDLTACQQYSHALLRTNREGIQERFKRLMRRFEAWK